MNRLRRFWAAGRLALSAVMPGGAGGPEAATTSYSGIVLSVDQATGTIVLGEAGSRLKNGKSAITRRSFQVTPSTTFVRVKRAAGAAPTGWTGDYVETKPAAADIKPGEWVTVAVEGGKQRRTAVKVTVVGTSEP